MRLTGLLVVILTAVPGCVRWGPSLRPDELNAITMAHLTPEQAERVEALPALCSLNLTARNTRARGTAVVLGPDRLMMSWHQLDDVSNCVFIQGEWRKCEIIARGDDVNMPFIRTKASAAQRDANDWAVVRIVPPLSDPPAPAVLDPDRHLEEGDIVYAAGFWSGFPRGNYNKTETQPSPDLSVGRFAVLAPMVPEYADEVIWLRMIDVDGVVTGRGFSGGPVMAWDEDAGAFIVVGITVFGGWDYVGNHWVSARRVPAAAYE